MSKRIALIIHNDNYHEPSLSRLKMQIADTPTLATLLREPAIGNFDRVDILLNQPVAEVRRQVADLFHRKQRDDELLLYFVGHSWVDEAGQLYLAGVDTALDSLAETAISAAYLTDCMDRSFSRRQMLLLDCGYNQSSSTCLNGGEIAAAFKGRGYGRVVLMATDLGLTHHLIQGLYNGAADGDQDGQIELRELYEFIQGQSGQPISWLQPHQWIYGQQDRFVIARNPYHFVLVRPIKWDLIFGAIMAPLVIVVIGGEADLRASIGLAGLFLLLYALLYLSPD